MLVVGIRKLLPSRSFSGWHSPAPYQPRVCMRLSVSVKLLGRCLTVCLHWWSAREALLLLIHVARRSYIAIAYPPSCSGACFLVYRLHALHAGTSLVIACLCCRRNLLPLSRGNRSLRAGASCFSFLRKMLCDEGTICLRKECLSELLLETQHVSRIITTPPQVLELRYTHLSSCMHAYCLQLLAPPLPV